MTLSLLVCSNWFWCHDELIECSQLLLENAEMGCSDRYTGEFSMGWRIGCIGDMLMGCNGELYEL